SAPQSHRGARAPSRPVPSGLIRPNEQPFTFESALQAQPGPSTHRQPTPPPAAAAPSHHQPSMGFGGAILSFNRQAALEERIQRERAQERTMERLRRALRFPTTASARHILAQTFQRVSDRLQPYLYGNGDGNYDADVLDAFALSDALSDEAAFLQDDDDLFGDNDTILSRLRRLQPEFKSAYTHPQPAAPGFTHDFSLTPTKPAGPEVIVIDDDLGPSTSTAASSSSSAASDVKMTLVCAHCLDALVIGGSGSEAKQAQRKLWGLRCGHLLDGKCVEALMKPPQDPTIETDGVEVNQEEKVDVKGKGKAKAVDDEDEPRMPGSFDVPTPAVAESAPSGISSSSADSNPIRSRLRPRNGSGHVEPHSASSTITPPLPDTRRRPNTQVRSLLATASRSRARGKAKGKQKAVEPLVEAEYEWRCPVSRCGHVHLSLKIEGKGILAIPPCLRYQMLSAVLFRAFVPHISLAPASPSLGPIFA
ncbi:hypothetical protein EVG20_g9384, partial [Dentipellis fragilis]